MTIDEFETIRLIDHLGFNQEQCAASMHVARTTAQRIYDEARRKLANCLVAGLPLRIEGGDYAVHEPTEDARPPCCPKQQCCRQKAPDSPPAHDGA